MATFRKSVSKTRAALENSTALPSPSLDILDHVGEDAARITTIAKASKSTRKAGSLPLPSQAAHLAPMPESIGGPEAASFTSIVEQAPSTMAHEAEARPSWSGEPLVAETLADVARPIVVDAEAARDLAARSVDDAATELESVMADAADQMSQAGADAVHVAEDLTAQNLSETAARTQDIAQAGVDTAVSSLENVASAAAQARPFEVGTPASLALGEFNARLADLFREHVEDSLTFFAALTAVRSVPEALSVNQQHFQRRLDAIATQSRDLTLLAGKVAAQTLMPFTPAAFR